MTYIVKQQIGPGIEKLAECNEFGRVTVHRSLTGAEAVVESLGGYRCGYFVARDRIRRDQTIVEIVD